MRKMVVFPEPLGPSRPMISPGPTARETWSTARRGPYHLVSCSAAMTAVIRRSIVLVTPRGGCPPRGVLHPIPQQRWLLELLWIVALGRLTRRAVGIVGGHEAGVLAPLQHSNVL